jgi:ubiquinone/menaquinone biosynthesis C-methylase UbiE
MLTADFDRLGLKTGDRVLDLGCGFGRHAFEVARRGAGVVAVDPGEEELVTASATFAAMAQAGQIAASTPVSLLRGDGLHLPFGDQAFDRVVCSEVLEHIAEDERAIAELSRVLRLGGTMAVTVPRFGPEWVNWLISDEYHETPGGHVRIYRRSALEAKLTRAGLRVTGHAHVHGLHSPYWWLKCLVGVANDKHLAVRAYHRFLVWDIMKRPALTRWLERCLSPLMGKSLVLYATKEAS